MLDRIRFVGGARLATGLEATGEAGIAGTWCNERLAWLAESPDFLLYLKRAMILASSVRALQLVK